MRWLLAVGLLCAPACNAVFDLDETPLIADSEDEDADGIADEDDNCAAARWKPNSNASTSVVNDALLFAYSGGRSLGYWLHVRI